MKKKVAANAEKEKLAAAEKNEKTEKAPEKTGEKTAEKADKPEKHDKSADKKSEKKDHAEKKIDKPEQQVEKSKDEGSSSSKEDKSGKVCVLFLYLVRGAYFFYRIEHTYRLMVSVYLRPWTPTALQRRQKCVGPRVSSLIW